MKVLIVLALLAGFASAHMALLYPEPWDPSSSIKTGPCGTRSNDSPIGKANTVLAPGRHTFTAEETVPHTGAPMRFALAWLDDPNDYTTLQTCDFSSHIIRDHIPRNDAVDNADYAFDIYLPDIDCPNCYLQFIQVMTDKTQGSCDGDLDTDWNTVYYSCASITITGSQDPEAYDWTYQPLPGEPVGPYGVESGGYTLISGNEYMWDNTFTNFVSKATDRGGSNCDCLTCSPACTGNTTCVAFNQCGCADGYGPPGVCDTPGVNCTRDSQCTGSDLCMDYLCAVNTTVPTESYCYSQPKACAGDLLCDPSDGTCNECSPKCGITATCNTTLNVCECDYGYADPPECRTVDLPPLEATPVDPDFYTTYISEEDGNFRAYWRIFRGDIDVIEFAIEVDANGWAALGFRAAGSSGGMGGCDIVWGHVDAVTGEAFVSDEWTNSNTDPDPDVDWTNPVGQDNLLSYNGTRNGDTLTLKWRRELTNEDDYDVDIVEGAQYYMIWGRGGISNGEYQKHNGNNRGKLERMEFFTPGLMTDLAEGGFTFSGEDVIVDNNDDGGFTFAFTPIVLGWTLGAIGLMMMGATLFVLTRPLPDQHESERYGKAAYYDSGKRSRGSSRSRSRSGSSRSGSSSGSSSDGSKGSVPDIKVTNFDQGVSTAQKALDKANKKAGAGKGGKKKGGKKGGKRSSSRGKVGGGQKKSGSGEAKSAPAPKAVEPITKPAAEPVAAAKPKTKKRVSAGSKGSKGSKGAGKRRSLASKGSKGAKKRKSGGKKAKRGGSGGPKKGGQRVGDAVRIADSDSE